MVIKNGLVGPLGGIVLIKPNPNITTSNSLPYLNKVYSENLSKPSSFYKSDPTPKKNKYNPNPPNPPSPAHSPTKLSGGTIAGIVVGSLVGFFLLIGIILGIYYYFLGKNLIKYYRHKN